MDDMMAADKEPPIKDRYNKDLSNIAGGAGINFAGKIFGAALQYIHLIVISKILGASLLGGFLLGITILNIVSSLSRLGLDLSVIKFVAQYLGNRDMARVKGVISSSIVTVSLLGFFSAAVLYLSSDLLSDLFSHKPGFKQVLQVLGSTIPLTSVILICLTATQGAKIMKYMTYGYHITLPLINLMVVSVLYLAGYKLGGVITGYYIATVSTVILSIFFLGKTFPGLRFHRPVFELKKLFSVSIPLAFVPFFIFILMWTDTLMLGYFSSSAEVGIYNTAMKTALLISMVLYSFDTIFAPLISDLHNKGDFVKLEALFKTVTRWIFVISLPIFFVMTMLSENIMELFGLHFIAGSVLLKILSFSHLINAGAGCVGFMLAMSGRQNLFLYSCIIVCLINFLLNYYLIPVYGTVGAAAASTTAMIALNSTLLIEIFFLMNMHPFSKKFIKPIILGSTLYVGFTMLFKSVPEFHFIAELVIYSLLYMSLYCAGIYYWCLVSEDMLILDTIKIKLRPAEYR